MVSIAFRRLTDHLNFLTLNNFLSFLLVCLGLHFYLLLYFALENVLYHSLELFHNLVELGQKLV